jgi:hypothetical protein
VSKNDSPPPSGAGSRRLMVTAVVVAGVAGGVGFALGRAGGGGSPIDVRPSSGAVVARFDHEAVTAGEFDALAGPTDSPLRAQLKDPAARKEFVEGWTRTLLLARRAEAEGMIG